MRNALSIWHSTTTSAPHFFLFFNAFRTAVLDKYVYYCKPSNATNLFAEAWLQKIFI